MDMSAVAYADTTCAVCAVAARMTIYVIFDSGTDRYELGDRFEGAILNRALEGSTTRHPCGGDLCVEIEIVDRVLVNVTTRPATPRDETGVDVDLW